MRVEHRLAVRGRHRPVLAGGHRLAGDVAGQVPVDRAALPRHQLAQPLEGRADVAAAARRTSRPTGRWARRRRRAAGGAGRPGSLALAVILGTGVEPEGEVAHGRPRVRSVGWLGCVVLRCADLAGWVHHDCRAVHRSHRASTAPVRGPVSSRRGDAEPAVRSRRTAPAEGPGRRRHRSGRRPRCRPGRRGSSSARTWPRSSAWTRAAATSPGVTWRVLDVCDPALASRLSSVDTVVHLAVRHLARRRRPGAGRAQRPRARRPCSPRRPRAASAASCCAPRPWSTAPSRTTRCRSTTTPRCAPCPTAACSRTGWRSSGWPAQAPRSHRGLR